MSYFYHYYYNNYNYHYYYYYYYYFYFPLIVSLLPLLLSSPPLTHTHTHILARHGTLYTTIITTTTIACAATVTNALPHTATHNTLHTVAIIISYRRPKGREYWASVMC